MLNAPPALRTFTDCLWLTSIGRLQHEFFPTLPPVQDRSRLEMVRADHVSDLPELSQLSGSSGSSQADPECVGRLARRLESAYFPVVIRSCTAALAAIVRVQIGPKKVRNSIDWSRSFTFRLRPISLDQVH